MRNASEQDLGDGNWNVYAMYQVEHPWHGILLAHIKGQVQFNYKNMLAMETHDGCPIIAEYEWLHPIPRKQGTPAKPKRQHVRGTKPWLSKFEYVDYDPSLIKIGTRVKCRDKKIRTIKYMTNICLGYEIEHCDVYKETGKYGFFDYSDCDIMKILVEKNIEKPVHDRYNGYAPNIWHFWQGNTNKHPVDGDVKVQIFCRGNTISQAEDCTPLYANNWYWKWDNCHCDIIAFRIVGEC